ncbi:MAG: peroxiredoxin [Microthrixaceae bacterium]
MPDADSSAGPQRQSGAPKVGDLAPGFALDGVDGATGERRRYESVEFTGSPLVIAFYPGDNTPVCTRQLVSYTSGIASLRQKGANLVAISPQDVDSHVRFADSQGGFAFPLLSDVDKEVGAAFGNLGLLGLYKRSIFVLDGEGRITYVHRSLGPGVVFQKLDDIVAHVAG